MLRDGTPLTFPHRISCFVRCADRFEKLSRRRIVVGMGQPQVVVPGSRRSRNRRTHQAQYAPNPSCLPTRNVDQPPITPESPCLSLRIPQFLQVGYLRLAFAIFTFFFPSDWSLCSPIGRTFARLLDVRHCPLGSPRPQWRASAIRSRPRPSGINSRSPSVRRPRFVNGIRG